MQRLRPPCIVKLAIITTSWILACLVYQIECFILLS